MNAATANRGAVFPDAPAPAAQAAPLDYFEQINPPCPTICGRTLKPLSITRYKTLKRLKVGFVSDEPVEATARDLMIGVLVCSTTAAEFAEMLSGPSFEKDLDRWARKFHFLPPTYYEWPLVGKWLKRMFSAIEDEMSYEFLRQELIRFQEYIVANSRLPRYWDESQDDRISGAHWAHNLEVVLRSSVGWGKDEIDEAPLNQALWDYFKYMENQGAVRLMTPDEIVEADTPSTPEEKAAMTDWLTKLQLAADGKLNQEVAHGQ